MIEALPENMRETILDTVSSLQSKIFEYIEKVLNSEETVNRSVIH